MKLINIIGECSKIDNETAIRLIQLTPKNLIKIKDNKIILFDKPNQILFVIKKPTKKVLDFIKKTTIKGVMLK